MAINTNIQESEYEAILRQAVAVLPWGHILTLMRKFGADDSAISYYAQETMSKGWNRELLSSAMTLKIHLKKSESLDSNFVQTLPAPQAMFANEVFKSGYNLSFLRGGVKDPILETKIRIDGDTIYGERYDVNEAPGSEYYFSLNTATNELTEYTSYEEAQETNPIVI